MPSKLEKNREENELRRDPYDVLGVSRTSTDQQIKSAYRKLALKFHPDKNGNDPKAADMFKEITYSYTILSDPDKRKQYDSAGFEAVEAERQDLELDLSSLGAMNTMFVALFSKLGVGIKTLVSANVLEDAINGSVPTLPLALGKLVSRKVEKQCAHFYSVRITEKEAQAGIVCRVQSADKSKFKLLYFDRDENGGLNLALQEDSAKKGKVTAAGMFFLGFPVYRLDQQSSAMANKDPDNGFFKKLQGFQPCEITELKAGVHVFAVYGDNFYKSAAYTFEVVSAAVFVKEKENLRAVESRISAKRTEISMFENEYRQVITQFTEMSNRYTQEMKRIDDLLKERNEIQASYTTAAAAMAQTKTSSRSKKRGGMLKDATKKKWFR